MVERCASDRVAGQVCACRFSEERARPLVGVNFGRFPGAHAQSVSVAWLHFTLVCPLRSTPRPRGRPRSSSTQEESWGASGAGAYDRVLYTTTLRAKSTTDHNTISGAHCTRCHTSTSSPSNTKTPLRTRRGPTSTRGSTNSNRSAY